MVSMKDAAMEPDGPTCINCADPIDYPGADCDNERCIESVEAQERAANRADRMRDKMKR